MAERIGGVNGSSPNYYPTWGRLRSPLVLDNEYYLPVFTTFSRQYPSSVEDPVPKFMIWESGSLFRCVAWGGPGTTWSQPYYWIDSRIINEGTPEEDVQTIWGVGLYRYGPTDQVDNQDFNELIGEALDTDVGTFIINQDAHSPTFAAFQQLDDGVAGTEIYAIGKLDPV